MLFIFNTYFVAAFGFTLAVIYSIILISTGRRKEFNLPSFGGVWFQGGSIIAGFKLMYMTYVSLLNEQTEHIQTDKMYMMYGGFSVIWICVNSLYSKIKKE